MIDLNIPEKVETMQNNMKNLARSMFRPISRKYDEAEHEYPKELDFFRNLPIMNKPKKKDKDPAKAAAKKTEGGEGGAKLGANLGLIFSTEALCWGDAADRKSVV